MAKEKEVLQKGAEDPKTGAKALDVVDQNGRSLRPGQPYTYEIHGADFAILAEEYASHTGGKVVKLA